MWRIKGPKGGNFKQLKLRNVIYLKKLLLIKVIKYEHKSETGFEVYFLTIVPLPFALFVLKISRIENLYWLLYQVI